MCQVQQCNDSCFFDWSRLTAELFKSCRFFSQILEPRRFGSTTMLTLMQDQLGGGLAPILLVHSWGKWLRKCNLSNLKLLILWGRVHIYAFNPSKAVGKGELFWFFTQPWCEMLEGRTAPLLGVEGPTVGRCGQQHAGWDPFAGTAPFHWNELTAFSSFSCWLEAKFIFRFRRKFLRTWCQQRLLKRWWQRLRRLKIASQWRKLQRKVWRWKPQHQRWRRRPG